MKRLMISKLMDEYVDTEFFPTGANSANPEAVKGWVLANANALIPAKKKQITNKKKMLLVAALAGILLVLAGAGFPYIQHRLVNGKLSFEQTSDGRITSFVHYSPVVELKNGRLFFNPDNAQQMDITDLVSEETPYIYDGTDPETGMMYYIIMGGTSECYGCVELIDVSIAPSDFSFGTVTAVGKDEVKMTTMYSFIINDGETDRCSFAGYDIFELCKEMNIPWLLAGAEKLGITFVNCLDYSEEYAVAIES